MNLIPQRLFSDPQVATILRDGNMAILNKKLDIPIKNREGYISTHVISIVRNGRQIIKTYEEEIIKVEEGEIIFIPRGLYHITDMLPTNGSFNSLLFYFDDSVIHEFLSSTKITDVNRSIAPNHLKFGLVPLVSSFGESLLHIYENQRLENKGLLKLKLLEILHLLNGMAKEQDFANFLFRLTLPKKRNIKTFMENNFDKPLKIEDYSYLTGRSQSSFRRDFKSQFDTTPRKWLKAKRMALAMTIINTKNISVTDLAYEVGYENISYFIKEFKLEYGLSPKQYIITKDRGFA